MIVNVERSPGYSQARYAQLWRHKGLVVLIMGNTIKERRDGTHWLWSANWSTGERINAPVTELEPYDGPKPSILDVVRQVEKWAHEGNGDAMWWLGDFYEFGSRATASGGQQPRCRNLPLAGATPWFLFINQMKRRRA